MRTAQALTRAARKPAAAPQPALREGLFAPKLEALRAELGKPAAKLKLLLADAADESALRAICAQTRVVVSTVGPYALYGEPLAAQSVSQMVDAVLAMPEESKVAILAPVVSERKGAPAEVARLEQILAATQTEMARLKDRVQVLEKLVTDDDRRLASDIERLRANEARG